MRWPAPVLSDLRIFRRDGRTLFKIRGEAVVKGFRLMGRHEDICPAPRPQSQCYRSFRDLPNLTPEGEATALLRMPIIVTMAAGTVSSIAGSKNCTVWLDRQQDWIYWNNCDMGRLRDILSIELRNFIQASFPILAGLLALLKSCNPRNVSQCALMCNLATCSED